MTYCCMIFNKIHPQTIESVGFRKCDKSCSKGRVVVLQFILRIFLFRHFMFQKKFLTYTLPHYTHHKSLKKNSKRYDKFTENQLKWIILKYIMNYSENSLTNILTRKITKNYVRFRPIFPPKIG